MHAEAIEFKQFDSLLDDTCEQRIVAAKAALGKRARKIVNQIKSTGSGGKARKACTGKDVRSFIGSPTHKLASNLSLYPIQ